jgi:hypothetical protein
MSWSYVTPGQRNRQACSSVHIPGKAATLFGPTTTAANTPPDQDIARNPRSAHATSTAQPLTVKPYHLVLRKTGLDNGHLRDTRRRRQPRSARPGNQSQGRVSYHQLRGRYPGRPAASDRRTRRLGGQAEEPAGCPVGDRSTDTCRPVAGCEYPNSPARVTWASVISCRRLRVSRVSRSGRRYGRVRSVLVCAAVGTRGWLMTRRW